LIPKILSLHEIREESLESSQSPSVSILMLMMIEITVSRDRQQDQGIKEYGENGSRREEMSRSVTRFIHPIARCQILLLSF
jgi:hypothetical protein